MESAYTPAPENRRTPRLRCDVPVRVVSPSNWPPVELVDLSRTGVRLVMDPGRRPEGADDSLASLASQLRSHLAMKVVIDFHPDLLGSLVRRSLQIVRLGLPEFEHGKLEIGCVLVPELTEDDAEALGVPLPREGEPPDVARRRMRAQEPFAREPAPLPGEDEPLPVPDSSKRRSQSRPGFGTRAAPSLTVQVIPRIRSESALKGKPIELGPEGGVAWVSDDPGKPMFSEAANIADRVVAFSKAYGSTVDLSIEDGPVHCWHGPVRVTSVGLFPEIPGRLILGFSFERPLEDWELEALHVEP